MIKVNGTDCDWEQGLTVEELLKRKRFVYSRIIVKVNGELIPKEEYKTKEVSDEDDVQAIHLLAGG